MFKSKEKEKTKIEKIIEDSQRMIDYYKEAIEKREINNEQDRLKILKEQLLIEELSRKEKIKKDLFTTLSEFLKILK